jgi:hypothetical protein
MGGGVALGLGFRGGNDTPRKYPPGGETLPRFAHKKIGFSHIPKVCQSAETG